MEGTRYSVFEYRYRDAANYKVEGRILLRGAVRPAVLQAIRSKLEPDDLFIAGQVGVPSLCRDLWASAQAAFDPELDHVWHEFVAMREATSTDVASLGYSGTVAALAEAFAGVEGWRLALSPNWD
jgi:hypothetical protein